MFWTLHLTGWLYPCGLVLFLEVWSILWIGPYFLSQCPCYILRGKALGIHQGGATHVSALWCCMWGRGQRGSNLAFLALSWLSVTSPASHKQIGPFWYWFPGGWVCVHSRTLWVSLINSLVRLRVSPTTTTPTDFYSQRFWGFISPHWNPGLQGLSCFPVVPPDLSECKCGTAQSSSHYLATHPVHPGCPSPPLLPVWMNISSLTPWLLDFQTVWFSDSSGYCLFLNLLSFFWLWEEAKCIHTCLHLGWKFLSLFFKLHFIDYAITVAPIFPLLPPSTQHPPSLRQSPHHCSCPWVMRICSLAAPFPILYIPVAIL